MNCVKWTRLSMLTVCALIACSGLALAGGGQHYCNGTSDLGGGALPPAGLYYENHLVLTHKDHLSDVNGDEVALNVSADVVANAARLLYVTPLTFLGASYSVHAVVPYYNADIDIFAPDGSSLVDSDASGIGDVTLCPALLGWHFASGLHMAAAIEFNAPFGSYDNRDASTQILSRNHWTVEGVLGASYLAGDFDISAKCMYDFNTTNDEYLGAGGGEVELKPGQEFHVDWAVARTVLASKELQIGVAGYNYWQTTDDEIDDVTVEDDRSRIGGVGPVIKYWPGHGKIAWTLKHYWEYGAENMTEGNVTQVKLQYTF